MVTLKTAYYINTDDVKELTGEHWGDFEFAQMAENDSYAILCLEDWYLEELYEEYEDEVRKEGDLTIADFEDEDEFNWHRRNCYAVRLKNQIKLVEILRKDFGLRDSVLIWISW